MFFFQRTSKKAGVNMRILIHDYAGHPFQVELSRALAKREHEVLHLYFGFNNTPKGDLIKKDTDPATFNIEGVFTNEPIRKYSYIKRWFQDIEYGKLISERISEFDPEIVLSANTPLDAQIKMMNSCKKADRHFLFWLQDVSGIAAHRLLRKRIPIVGEIIGRYHIHLERKMLRESSRVVLIADDFKPIVMEWSVAERNLIVIPNWAPLGDVPVCKKKNSWSVHQGLENQFCILYTGGLGLKHNPTLLLRLAQHFQSNDEIRIIIISEGPGATWLKKKQEELSLTNLVFLKYQPFDQMPEVMATGDILVAILEPDAGLFSVPSKVLTYLCAQRPLLVAIPQDNLAAKIVSENHTGIVVSPHAEEEFIHGAELLYGDPETCHRYGINARNYAEETFNIDRITDRFESMMRELIMN